MSLRTRTDGTKHAGDRSTGSGGSHDATRRHASLRSRLLWLRNAALAPLVVVLVLALITPSFALATTILIYAAAALGAGFLLGTVGLLSFAQGVPFGVGAYAGGLAMIHWDVQVPSALLIGLLAGVLSALLVGALSILGRGVEFVMLSFAFAALFMYMVYLFRDITGGENGLRGLPAPTFGFFGAEWITINTNLNHFFLAAGVFLIVYFCVALIAHSPLGGILRAIREDERRTNAVGYNTYLAKLIAFSAIGGLSGFAGTMYTIFLGTAPDTSLNIEMSTVILIMAILGGVASPVGPTLGAGAYLVISSLLSPYFERWQILLALALLAVVMFWRGGIYGAFVALKAKGDEIFSRSRRSRNRGDIRSESSQ